MRDGTPLEDWLRARRPEIPASFLGMLLEEGRGGRADGEGLASLGEAALARALLRPGRVRESAFLLLVGDAYLTYACEALARSADPGGKLTELLEGLGGRLG